MPYFIPRIAGYLARIADDLGIDRFHLMGISYGGFVALDFARQFQDRLHTLTLSGILLSHEVLFQMYQDISLRFYRGGPEIFELYTHYMYEKIFGESFVRAYQDKLDGDAAEVPRPLPATSCTRSSASPRRRIRSSRRSTRSSRSTGRSGRRR